MLRYAIRARSSRRPSRPRSGSLSATTTSPRAICCATTTPCSPTSATKAERRCSAYGTTPAALIADSKFNAEDLLAAGLGEAAIVPLPPRPARRRTANGRGTRSDRDQRGPDRPEQAARGRHQGLRPVPAPPGAGGFPRPRGISRGVRHLSARAAAAGRRDSARRACSSRAESHARRAMRGTGGHTCTSRCPCTRVSVRQLVEALAHGVPVVARAAGAVPETLGGAGLVLDGNDLPLCRGAARARLLRGDQEGVRRCRGGAARRAPSRGSCAPNPRRSCAFARGD